MLYCVVLILDYSNKNDGCPFLVRILKRLCHRRPLDKLSSSQDLPRLYQDCQVQESWQTESRLKEIQNCDTHESLDVATTPWQHPRSPTFIMKIYRHVVGGWLAESSTAQSRTSVDISGHQ